MKLLLPPAYVSQAAADMRNATTRIFLMSMVIADHPATHELIAELEAAARRGVPVTVCADVFTYGEVSGSYLPIKYYSANSRLATKMSKRLRSAGVTFHWLGRARSSVFTGRTHDKWCVIDDTSYTFGGVNMYEGGIANIDYMFKAENNPRLADRLGREQERIMKAERTASNYPSVTFALGEDKLLIDGGIVTKSVIYRRACELGREAEEVIFVSQYGPTGKLARILKSKPTQFYFNRAEQAEFINRVMLKIGSLFSGIKTIYTKKEYLHAKFIIFTMPDGSKRAITGSHNFAYTGVLFGTREVALETKDPKVISQLEKFLGEYVA
ncbi:MAG: phospholipase D-like domain-containing protein [Candidatus Saccharimonadales bacterium]